MGVQDRDWWQEAQRKRATGGGGGGSNGLTRGLKFGPLGIVVFWLVVMALVYGAMKLVLQPKPVVVSMTGEISIPKARDGHFYAPGSVNGKPVLFLVDTGASYVTVSQEFADHAGIGDGKPVRFRTASGTLDGRIVSDVPVSLGSAKVSAVKVGVGLIGVDRDQALLGQSFLSKFQITLTRDQMVLRPQ